jgi:hypothetical protein
MKPSKRDIDALEHRVVAAYRSQAATGGRMLTQVWRAGLITALRGRILLPFPRPASFWSETLERAIFRFAATSAAAATAVAAYGLVTVWGASADLLEITTDIGAFVSLQLLGL